MARSTPATKKTTDPATARRKPCAAPTCTKHRRHLAQKKKEVKKAYKRLKEISELIWNYGGIDGAHHKQWLLDQVVRKANGSPEAYEAWKTRYSGPYDEAEGDYENGKWDTGILC